MPGAPTFSEMAKALNRSPVYLSGLQKRFELPVFEGTAYSDEGGDHGAVLAAAEADEPRARVVEVKLAHRISDFLVRRGCHAWTDFSGARTGWKEGNSAPDSRLLPLVHAVSYTHLRAHETRHDL